MPAKATKKGKYWYLEINDAPHPRTFQKQVDKATAEWVAAEWNRANEKAPALGLSGSKAFADVAERWWAKRSARWRQTTVRTRRTALNRLTKLLGKRDIRELNEDEVGLIAEKLCPPYTEYTAPTVAGTMDILATIIGWSVGKVIKEHPCSGDETIRAIGLKVARGKCAPPDTRDAWTYEEVGKLLQFAKERAGSTRRTRNKQWLHDIVVFSLRTGCRLGELVALQWDDVDLVRGRVTFRQSRSYKEVTATKNTQMRTRQLADDVWDHLREMHARRLADPHVFLGANNKPMLAPSLSSRWPKLLDMFKPTERRLEWHCWRHTWASWALDQGWTPAKAAWYIGDTEEVFREHYAHILKDTDLDLNFFDVRAPAGAQQRQPEKAARKARLTLV